MKKRGKPRGKHASGQTQLRRLVKVLLALQRTRFGLTGAEIRVVGGCSIRTVYRLLQVMEEAGIKVERLPWRRTRGQTQWRFRVDPRVFTDMRIRRVL